MTIRKLVFVILLTIIMTLVIVPAIVFADDTENVPVTGVKLNTNGANILKGSTYTLTATVAPENATNKNVIWSSDNESIAIVNDGVVSAVGVGTTNINVMTEDGSYSVSCTISVYENHRNDLPIYNEDKTSEYAFSEIVVSGSGHLRYGGSSPYEGDMVFLRDDTKTYKEKRGTMTIYHHPEIYGYVKPFYLTEDAVVTIDFSSTDSFVGISTKNYTSTAAHSVTNTWCGYKFSNFSSMFIKPSEDGKYRLKGGTTYSVYIYRDNAEQLAQGKYNRKSGSANAYVSYQYNHTYGDWIITKEPTCTEEGIHEKRCTGCRHVVSETMPALGHSSTLSFTKDDYSLTTGESTTVYLSNTSLDATRWASTNSKVVRIDEYSTRKAVITAVGKGEASIIAIDDEGKGSECHINVALRQLTISASDMTIGIGNTANLTVEGAADITWKSSNTDIVSLDTNNYPKNKAKIKTEGLGEAVVTASDPYGASVSCTVKVVESYIRLDAQDVVLQTRGSKTVYVESGKASTAVSSDNNIVTASCTTGYISLKAQDKTGSATVTVTEKNGATITIYVVVESHIEVETHSIHVDLSEHQYYDYSKEVKITNGVPKSVSVENEEIVKAELVQGGKAVKVLFQDKLGETDILVTEVGGATATIHVKSTASFELSEDHLKVNRSYSDYYHDYYHDNYRPDFAFGQYDSDDYDDYYYDYDKIIYATRGNLHTVKSLDTNIVRIKESEYDGTYGIHPVGLGTGSIQCKDRYGQTRIVTIEVTDKYVKGYIKAKTKIGTVKYGAKKAKGKVPSGAKISIYIAGKKVKCTTKSTSYSAKIPVKKIGTKIRYRVVYDGLTYAVNQKVEKCKTKLSVSTVYRYTKKLKVTLKNVHKGDRVKVKIGRKTHTIKIKKDKKKYVCRVRISGSAGTKIRITVTNQFKQTLKTKTTKVYYAPWIKKGMTKSQCRNVPWWGKPDDKSYYSNGEIWTYDDGSWVVFKHGRIVGWYSA